MAIPAIVYGIGAALGLYGQLASSRSEARAREMNADAYRKQEEFSRFATARELDIFETESQAFLGDQISSFAKAGIDMSGSALMTIASTKAAIMRERAAISMGGERQVEQFRIAERQERDRAKYLRSPEAFFAQSMPMLLSFASGMPSFGGGGVGSGSGGSAAPKKEPAGTYSSGVPRFRYGSSFYGDFK